MTKYRLRLTNGRVMGPFDLNQIHDLKLKGHIQGQEEAQVFPLGEWKPLRSFDFYQDLMDENRTAVLPKSEDATFVIDLSHIRKKKNENDLENISLDDHAPRDHVSETIRISSPSLTPVARGNTAVTISEEIELPVAEDSGDKTLINPVAQEELRRMREEQAAEERRLREEEEARIKALEAQKEKSRSTKHELVVSPHDATQVITLGNKTELLNLAQNQELVIADEVQAFLQKRREEEGEDEEEEEEETLDSADDEKKKKRKKLFIVVAALAILYTLLFPGDDEDSKPKFRHINPAIVFPIPFDKKDTKLAASFYQQGRDTYILGTYPHLITAGGFFHKSVINDFDNVPAYSMMIRTYAEQLRFSKQKLTDAVTLFKAIQLKKQFILHDPDGVVGMNLFFMAIDKPEAAVDVVNKYLALYPKKVTQDLFAANLTSLMKVGQIDKAKDFFLALSKQKDRTKFALEAMIHYHLLNQEPDEAMKLADEGIKRFPNSNLFMLTKAELLLQKKETKLIPQILSAVEKRQIEYNDIYRAKFFEVMGLYLALKNKVKEATQFLKRSLLVYETSDLRVKLAELEKTGVSKDADAIIGQSQATVNLLEARKFANQKNYLLAMSAAARATDASPGHVPSELFLAKMQMKLGMAADSIKTLEKLIARQGDDKSVNLALIEAYTDSYKFKEARNRIAVISGPPLRNTWEYASVNARLYQKSGDVLKAIAWYKSAINANPLSDADIYQLAEIFLKRKNFPQARALLNNAMELDPVNPDYRVSYARLLYELEDDQAAIGYLLGLMNDFGENPKILGEIATFYYRSGKIKDFQDYKAKLEKLPTRDKALYEFLIKAALLDERYAEVPGLVEELLKIEPGDLEAMMTAGKILFENNKLLDAALWFKRVYQSMPTYPKVLYYIARVKFILGEVDDPVSEDGKAVVDENGDKRLGALSLVKNDMKENGESDIGLVFMAEIFTRKGDLIQAENHYKKAQKINPNSYEALLGLADISTRRNNFDLALDLYKKAMKLRNDEPILHKRIGDVYRLLGQGKLAIESYKLYLEMDPETSDKSQIEKYINLMQ